MLFELLNKEYTDLTELKNDFIKLSKEDKNKALELKIVKDTGDSAEETFRAPIKIFLEMYASMVNESNERMDIEKTSETEIIAPLGDWSDDGHGYSENVHYLTNMSKEDIQKSLLKSIEDLDLNIFNLFEDYQDRFLYVSDYKKLCTPSFLNFIFKSNHEITEIFSDIIYLRHYLTLKDIFNSVFMYLSDNKPYSVESASNILEYFILRNVKNPKLYLNKIINTGNNYMFGYWDKKLNESYGYGLFV